MDSEDALEDFLNIEITELEEKNHRKKLIMYRLDREITASG